MDRAGHGLAVGCTEGTEECNTVGVGGPQAGPTREEVLHVIGRGEQATRSREWPKGGERLLAPSHTFAGAACDSRSRICQMSPSRGWGYSSKLRKGS